MNQDIIAALAAQKLGAAPAGAPQGGAPAGADPAAAAAAAAAAGQQGAPTPPKADPSPTSMEKAQSKLAPKDGAAQSAEESVQFIKIGDRELTLDQIQGTLSRYKDLNYRWQSEVAPMKPVLEMAKKLIDAAKGGGHDAKPEEAAEFIMAAVRAQMKNPQMGGDSKQGEQGGKTGADDDGELEAWERENAVKLPPGFKETRQTTKQMQEQMAQMMGMMQQLIQGAPQGQQAQQQAQQIAQQGQQQQADASLMMIRNNLDRAFAAAQIDASSPETRNDFRMFAAQRGYDFPDFIDPEMTAIVVRDYKANKDSPEVERLRQIHAKRQAFTGGDQASPGAGGATGSPAVADPTLAGLISGAMSKRGLG